MYRNGVPVAVHNRIDVRCADGHGFGVDCHGYVLGSGRVNLGLRRPNSDVCFTVRRDFLDRQRAGSRVNGDIIFAAGLDGVADRAAARHGIGQASADALIRIAEGHGDVLSADGLRLALRFNDRERTGLCIPDVIVGVLARGHGDCVGSNGVALLTGSGIVEGLTLYDAALQIVEHLYKPFVWILLRHFACGRNNEIIHREEVAVFICAAILGIGPGEGVIAGGEVAGVRRPTLTLAAFFKHLVVVHIEAGPIAITFASVVVIEGERTCVRQRDIEH